MQTRLSSTVSMQDYRPHKIMDASEESSHDSDQDRIICMRSYHNSVENDHCHLETMELRYKIWQYWDIHDYWLVLLGDLKEPYVFIFSNDTRITNKCTTLREPKTQRQHFRVLIHITGLLHYMLCHYSEILAWIIKINEYKPFCWQAHP